MTTIDGKYVSEDERMRMLRLEELEALGMWEIPNNALLTARLSPHTPPSTSKAESAGIAEIAKANPDPALKPRQVEDLEGFFLNPLEE